MNVDFFESPNLDFHKIAGWMNSNDSNMTFPASSGFQCHISYPNRLLPSLISIANIDGILRLRESESENIVKKATSFFITDQEDQENVLKIQKLLKETLYISDDSFPSRRQGQNNQFAKTILAIYYLCFLFKNTQSIIDKRENVDYKIRNFNDGQFLNFTSQWEPSLISFLNMQSELEELYAMIDQMQSYIDGRYDDCTKLFDNPDNREHPRLVFQALCQEDILGKFLMTETSTEFNQIETFNELINGKGILNKGDYLNVRDNIKTKFSEDCKTIDNLCKTYYQKAGRVVYYLKLRWSYLLLYVPRQYPSSAELAAVIDLFSDQGALQDHENDQVLRDIFVNGTRRYNEEISNLSLKLLELNDKLSKFKPEFIVQNENEMRHMLFLDEMNSTTKSEEMNGATISELTDALGQAEQIFSKINDD